MQAIPINTLINRLLSLNLVVDLGGQQVWELVPFLFLVLPLGHHELLWLVNRLAALLMDVHSVGVTLSQINQIRQHRRRAVHAFL